MKKNHFHLKPLHWSNKIIPKKLNGKAALTQEGRKEEIVVMKHSTVSPPLTWILGAFKVKRPVSPLLSVNCLLWASSHSRKAERERESHYVKLEQKSCHICGNEGKVGLLHDHSYPYAMVAMTTLPAWLGECVHLRLMSSWLVREH